MNKAIDDNRRITILALSWRDIKHPKMGGAEVYTHEMLKGAVEAGMSVIHFGTNIEGIPKEEDIEGIHYIRQGNAISVIKYARSYYKKHQNEIDIVIDQCNTHRFFTRFWVPEKKRLYFIHQLTREIWDLNLPWPISKIGKLLETPMLRLQRKDMAITVSESTKKDLVDVGFRENKVIIVPEGNEPDMLGREVDWNALKGRDFIFVGRYSKYKGIDISVEALGIVKEKYADAKLYIVGKKDEDFIKKELVSICEKYHLSIGDDISNDIVTCGYVTVEEKARLMSNARALVFPSLREGWGMIITEAGAMGTPSITCNLPGTRDAIMYGKSGYLCEKRQATDIAEKMLLAIENEELYQILRKKAYDFANTLTWEKTRAVFVGVVNQMISTGDSL